MGIIWNAEKGVYRRGCISIAAASSVYPGLVGCREDGRWRLAGQRDTIRLSGQVDLELRKKK